MADTNSISAGFSTFFPINEAVGAMVFSLEDSSVPVMNPVMAREALFVCKQLGFNSSKEDSPGNISLSFCVAVLIKSHQNLSCSSG